MSRIIDIRLVRTRDDEWRASSQDAPVHVKDVHNCRSCPMHSVEPHGHMCSLNRYDVVRHPLSTPTWCPLRNGPLVLALRGRS